MSPSARWMRRSARNSAAPSAEVQRELHITTILVTHDQEEAFALADRIGVMNQGRLLECGRPDDLYMRPATRFVATFLGAANLLLGYPTRSGVRSRCVRPRRPVPARPSSHRAKWWRCCDRGGRACGRGGAHRGELRRPRARRGSALRGAVERLRVRMPENGRSPPRPGAIPAEDEGGSLLESRARSRSSAGSRSRPGSAWPSVRDASTSCPRQCRVSPSSRRTKRRPAVAGIGPACDARHPHAHPGFGRLRAETLELRDEHRELRRAPPECR